MKNAHEEKYLKIALHKYYFLIITITIQVSNIRSFGLTNLKTCNVCLPIM